MNWLRFACETAMPVIAFAVVSELTNNYIVVFITGILAVGYMALTSIIKEKEHEAERGRKGN